MSTGTPLREAKESHTNCSVFKFMDGNFPMEKTDITQEEIIESNENKTEHLV
jgi:hypothetical protein